MRPVGIIFFRQCNQIGQTILCQGCTKYTEVMMAVVDNVILISKCLRPTKSVSDRFFTTTKEDFAIMTDEERKLLQAQNQVKA